MLESTRKNSFTSGSFEKTSKKNSKSSLKGSFENQRISRMNSPNNIKNINKKFKK